MPNLPMREHENFTKRTYTRSDMPDVDLTFSQLCASFGFKYNAVYRLVRFRGYTVEEAISYCVKTPSTWGQTYSNVPYKEQ